VQHTTHAHTHEQHAQPLSASATKVDRSPSAFAACSRRAAARRGAAARAVRVLTWRVCICVLGQAAGEAIAPLCPCRRAVLRVLDGGGLLPELPLQPNSKRRRTEQTWCMAKLVFWLARVRSVGVLVSARPPAALLSALLLLELLPLWLHARGEGTRPAGLVPVAASGG
jgi:hypothetical protein